MKTLITTLLVGTILATGSLASAHKGPAWARTKITRKYSSPKKVNGRKAGGEGYSGQYFRGPEMYGWYGNTAMYNAYRGR